MRFLPISLDSPLENILLDEVLLDRAEKNGAGEVLRIWESREVFVVLGRTGKIDEDVDLAAAAGDKIPVLRRTSGGGTVVQGPGCLNFSLVLSRSQRPRLNDIRKSYLEILEPVITALRNLEISAEFRPISDLVLMPDDKKFSGNAQHRGRKFVLHHGTILYDFNLGLISRYLKMPKSIPQYRRSRSHADFVANVPLSPEKFAKMCRKEFSSITVQPALTPAEQDALAEFVRRNSESILSGPRRRG